VTDTHTGTRLDDSYNARSIIHAVVRKKRKSVSSHKAHKAVLISVSLALSQTPVFTLRDHRYEASASRVVPVYVPAFAGTHCVYPRENGQA